MELLKDRTNKVYFEGDSTIASVNCSFTITDDVAAPVTGGPSGATRVDPNPGDPDYDLWEFTLPYVNTEGTATVLWEFTPSSSATLMTQQDVYEIVTPYLTVREVKKIFPTATDEEAIEIEGQARRLIDNACMQTFGKRDRAVAVLGTGEQSLVLPYRLLSFTDVDDTSFSYNTASFVVKGDGWYLAKVFIDPSVDGNLIKYALPEAYSDPIVYPYARDYYEKFRKNVPYTIVGTWGWTTIPGAIKDAMRILVADLACVERGYRDRYIESMTSADWRFQFNGGAWTRTGNAQVDALIDPYIVQRGWHVI